MAAQSEGGGKDDIKTQFATREGTYRLMHLSEYSRPTRAAYNGQANAPVKVSFINVNDASGSPDRICFNVGRELYFYVYKGVRKAADLTKPIDKRIYKGTFPTCHDFNHLSATCESVLLLVGFTAGQVQLIDPIKQEISKLYNEERLIDKSKVTCIKWIPGSPNQFLVSHASGQIYVYNEDLPCGGAPPHYQPFKQGEGYAIYTCKTKSTRNPLYRWLVGQGPINEFAFSPCSRFLAVVGQDGYLRVFNYDSMDLVGSMKSYFGGLLCVCWSPDGKYLVTGGEDDLVTVWSFHEKKVICRGEGHRSWVNVVAFDPYTSNFSDTEGCDFSGSDEEFHYGTIHNHEGKIENSGHETSTLNRSRTGSNKSFSDSRTTNFTSYRFGSVGQDTILCLWDLTEDVLKQPLGRARTSTIIGPNAFNYMPRCNSLPNSQKSNSLNTQVPVVDGNSLPNASVNITAKFATLSLGDRKDKDHDKKEHKRNLSLAGRSSEKVSILKTNVRPIDESLKLLGTPACPRLDEIPILEPLICKKIAHERLTALVFREECIVTACQEGFVYTWARPGKVLFTKIESCGDGC